MNLSVKEDPQLEEIQVAIACPRIDSRVCQIIEAAEAADLRLAGLLDGYLHIVGTHEVLYIEAVDGKTFLYTAQAVLESSSCLQELETDLVGTEFIRASRQLLVNLAHLERLRPYLNARLELVLDNQEHLIASRQFAPAIKRRIGI